MKIYYATLFFLLFGCASINETETQGLNELLFKFNTQIPENEHVYFLIPAFSCHGCVQITLSRISKYLSPKYKPYVTFISGIGDIDLKKFSNSAVVFTDTHHYMEQLPFEVANVTMVKTRKSKILEVYCIGLGDIEPRINEKLFSFED